MASIPLGYFWNSKLAERKVWPPCPDTSGRYRALAPELILKDWASDQAQHFDFQPLDPEILTLVHSSEYIESIKSAPSGQARRINHGNVLVTPDLYDQALLAASGGCTAVDAVCKGLAATAFCAVRPPGQHANSKTGRGFSIFNNAAIAVRYAQQRLNIPRVMLLNFSGTPAVGAQEIFWRDSSVFVLSFHQQGRFGKVGSADWVGAGEGEGYHMNYPLPAGIKGEDLVKTFNNVFKAMVQHFAPGLLIMSLGFDLTAQDLISEIKVSETVFADVTRIALHESRAYTGGKVVSLLEGGYAISGLSKAVLAHCDAMITETAAGSR